MAPYRIQGTLLPSGSSRDVFVVDGRITFEGVEDAETLLEEAVLIPGLVDVHAHLALASPAPDDSSPRQRAEASARAHLDAGVLLIREPGSPDHASNGIGPHVACPERSPVAGSSRHQIDTSQVSRARSPTTSSLTRLRKSSGRAGRGPK